MTGERYQVVVVGGGMAGTVAALTAARLGARTLLVERSAELGGVASRAWVTPWQSFHSPRGRVVGGIPQLIVERLVEMGACLGHVPDPIGFAPSLTPVEPRAVAPLLVELAREAGVELSLETSLTGVEVEEGRVAGLTLARGGEESQVRAGAVVDATGSALVARMAGLPTELSEERQPASLLFRMSGVDGGEIIAYMEENPEEFVLNPDRRVLRLGYLAVSGFFSLVREARERGELRLLNRDRVLFFGLPSGDEVIVNTTRLEPPPTDDPSSPHYQRYYREGVEQVRELAGWMVRRLPGFARAEMTGLAQELGIRESFRLVGAYLLSAEDVLSGRHFADSVALGSFPIDIHRQDAGLESYPIGGEGDYGIPLGCLHHPTVANLYVAGKGASFSHRAFASARTIPTAMSLGQAAGILAFLASEGMAAGSPGLGESFGELARGLGHIHRPEQIVRDQLTRNFLSAD